MVGCIVGTHSKEKHAIRALERASWAITCPLASGNHELVGWPTFCKVPHYPQTSKPPPPKPPNE